MKEARIDGVINNVAETCLVVLPKTSLYPEELLRMNVEHKKQMGKLQ